MADKRTRWIIEATSNIPDINTQLEKLIQLQRTQNDLTQQNTTSTALAIQRQREQIEQLTSSQTKANTAATAGGKQQSDMIGTLRKEYDMLSKTLSGIAQLAAGAWAVGQLKTFVMEVINAKSAQDGFVASMEKMLGSRLKAEELNAKLMDIASKSPFTITQIQDVTKQLQGMGVETNKLIPYINALGDIAAIVGTGKLPLIAKAMTDVQNKGILMGGEIRQFTENGIPLFDLLAKSMEKPREEVVKLANAHKISFAEVEKAILQSTQKGGLYFGQMAAQAEQLGGKVSNLGDKFTLGLAKVGDYFDKGIKKGIEVLGDLIDATMGSSSAIERSGNILQAAASIYALYRVAVISVNAALKANQVETLAGLAAKEADAVATVSMTVSTTGLRTAMTGLWMAMRANPIGAVITLVTALYTAYEVWDAASQDVVSSLGEEEIKLQGQKQLLNDSVTSVTALAMGTNERKKAMEGLISKYPEYFGGLSVEATSNATLNQILGRVNQSYNDRIDLARQAYKVSALEEKRGELLKQELELMERIKQRSPELYAQLGGDSEKLMEMIKKGGSDFLIDLDKKGGMFASGWDNIMNGTIVKSALTVTKGLKDIDKEMLDASQRQMTIEMNKHNSAIEAESTRWVNVAGQMTKGTKEYEAAQDEHEKRVRDMSGKTTEFVAREEEKKGAIKKSSTELSLENDLKELKSMEQTFAVKMEMLNKEQELKTEQARRQIVNVNDENERILSIEREFQAKRNETVMEYAGSLLVDIKRGFDERVQAQVDMDTKLGASHFKLSEDVIANIKKENEARKDNLERAIKASEELVEIAGRFQEESIKAGASDAEEHARFWESKKVAVANYWIDVTEKQIQGNMDERQRLADHMAKMLEIYGANSAEYKEALNSYLLNEEDLAKNKSLLEGWQESMKMGWLEWAKNLVGAIDSIVQGIATTIIAGLEQVDAAFDGAIDAYSGLLDANRTAMNTMLEDTRLTYEEKERLLGESLEREKAILADTSHLRQLKDENAAYMQELKDGFETTSKGFAAVTSLLNGDIGSMVSNMVGMFTDMFTNQKKQMYEEEAMRHQTNANNLADTIESLNNQMAAEGKLLEAKFEMWDKELADFKALQDEKLAAANALMEKLTAAERQHSADNQLRLQEDQAFRNQLLADGEAREIQSLNDSRDRLIADANEKRDRLLADANEKKATVEELAAIEKASAEEVTNIVNAFAELIKDKHAEYSDAKGNKDKEVSLAIQEQKEQETDKVGTLEKQLTDTITQLKNELSDKEASLSAQKQSAQAEYAQYVQRIQGQIFEAEKQMAIAQINVEIALLRSKRNIFNKGKINEAIGDLEQAIGEISSTGNPGNYGVPAGGGGRGGRGNSDPGRPSGADDAPGRDQPRGGFHGSPWLSRKEWEPYGVDEIYMRTQEGERLMPVYLNQHLGRNVSNEELVHGYLQYANFSDRLPDISVPNVPSLQLPDFANSNKNAVSMERVEQKLDQLNKTFASKSLINVQIDGNAVSISEQWATHKANYYDTLFNR